MMQAGRWAETVRSARSGSMCTEGTTSQCVVAYYRSLVPIWFYRVIFCLSSAKHSFTYNNNRRPAPFIGVAARHLRRNGCGWSAHSYSRGGHQHQLEGGPQPAGQGSGRRCTQDEQPRRQEGNAVDLSCRPSSRYELFSNTQVQQHLCHTCRICALTSFP